MYKYLALTIKTSLALLVLNNGIANASSESRAIEKHSVEKSSPENSSLAFSECGNNENARQLAKLIILDPRQPRQKLSCNSLLTEIADKKAKEMAELGRVTHVGRSSANKRLIDAGYPLSKIYPRLFENNVEAIAGGISDANEMWEQFKLSETHRTHLLAEHEFYLLQDEIGVGFFKDRRSPHVEYWVVYLAHQGESKAYRGKVAKSKD
ncbi:CAP domain-containing protein [Aliikangiella marina]|uniref:CAP domain-containing protein n=1 Tax=Aliikangiella marina TaxID=1712262 RepID=A0A545T1A7_9GAMM|nr:CAP domain-containing protein [Aliikangiella marina]TQV70991.1 CAP domain-containing protein [Aliikangiella marina]